MNKPELFTPTPEELKEAAQKIKNISIEINEEESRALTSVLCNLVDYYSTLRDSKEEWRLLVLATELNKKIVQKFYE